MYAHTPGCSCHGEWRAVCPCAPSCCILAFFRRYFRSLLSASTCSSCGSCRTPSAITHGACLAYFFFHHFTIASVSASVPNCIYQTHWKLLQVNVWYSDFEGINAEPSFFVDNNADSPSCGDAMQPHRHAFTVHCSHHNNDGQQTADLQSRSVAEPLHSPQQVLAQQICMPCLLVRERPIACQLLSLVA